MKDCTSCKHQDGEGDECERCWEVWVRSAEMYALWEAQDATT